MEREIFVNDYDDVKIVGESEFPDSKNPFNDV